MPDLTTAVHLPLGATFILAGAAKLASVRRPPLGYRRLWGAVFCVGVADIFNASLLYRWAERELGAGWPMVISHLALIATTACAFDLAHVLYGNDDRVRARSLALAFVTASVAITPWLIAPPATTPTATENLSVYYDRTWQSALHWSTAMSYLTWQLIVFRHIAVERARAEHAGPARTGLEVMNWSYVVAIAGFIVDLSIQAVWLLGDGPRWTRADFDVSTGLAGLAMSGMLLGIIWPTAHQTWTRSAWRLPFSSTRREFESIHAYWSTLIDRLPGTTYFPHDVTGHPTSHEQLMWQRSRMVTEIHDLQRRLAHYTSTDDEKAIVDAVQHCWPAETPYAITAATTEVRLRLALRRLHDDPPGLAPDPARPGTTATLAEAAAAIAATSRIARSKTHQAVLDRILHKELR